ncbi:recombinase family protein [Noviherbaspirillum saxi]|uniref:Recombinase domain-containing protein n=1 Tax=Noviherbaspirillum saxi TaxID=2320863 RepID=A0A3A3FLV6_9BURK|nr:hypothetical protein D3871_28345 [Noviherbaspirillum saxi]
MPSRCIKPKAELLFRSYCCAQMKTESHLHDELNRLQSAMRTSSGRIRRYDPSRTVGVVSVPQRLKDETFVESVLAMRLQGESYTKIAWKLNREGIGSPTGGRWYCASLHRYMRRRCCEYFCEWPKASKETT